ncbi:hypothetical protein CHLNCDRAFT_137018 [Chlorella variabilis]|uniref:F-box domain-containing protein n=1 Tax=Chlorella variabilis TaxID=554065 RepID=E1ZLT5_CHLVA|nr:hypothetical protein CHLNCDRAFT_137018 [Chlorella variabilis]EFN53319.1 hypothetical protein CHLNCDRAFT_137018 [Chlorella variabilis]|eukprot:XP_005845421.1 hypothetical protein CHLNCDRAFT_137018 [Chlorella variabilis]
MPASAKFWRWLAPGVMRTASRVCKRWRAVVFSEPALWRVFFLPLHHEFQQGELAARRVVLQRVGAMLLRFTQLAFLQLRLPELRQADMAALAQLPPLASLDCCARQVPACLADCLSQLSALETLRLESIAALPPMQQLTRSPRLRHLRIRSPADGKQDWLPVPSDFAALQTYDYQTFGFGVAGAWMAGCTCCRDPQGGEGDVALSLMNAAAVGALGALLRALVPAGARLTCLEVRNSALDAAPLHGCPDQLSALTELSLSGCSTARHQSDVPAVLAAPLGQAPRLADLSVMGGSLEALPECVTSRRGLTRLALEHNEPRKLPKGAYLADLRELDLSWNNVGRVPVSLKADTSLAGLSLHGDRPLKAADIEGVLARLPALTTLDLGNTGTPQAVLRELHARLPRLAILLSSRRGY